MEERKERCIRCEKMRVGDLKHGFGNPRKITKKKAEELERSLEMFGDFGIFLIDENDNVIAGNQRSIILTKKDPDIMVDCKRLIGYTDAELRAINMRKVWITVCAYWQTMAASSTPSALRAT